MGKYKYPRATFYFEGKQYSATGKTQREADQKAALKQDKMKRGEVGISSNMTVKRWAHEWLETYKKQTIAVKQYKDYQSMFNNMVLPIIGNLRLGEVKDVHLQKIINSNAGMSLDRLSKLRSRINALFKQAYASRLITRNPSEFLILPKATNGTHRSITDFERGHFLKVAATHNAGLMFKIMLFFGLRTGEVVALEWRDVDFETCRIKVARAAESGTNDIKEPKTKAGIREVPIPDILYNELFRIKSDPFQPIFTNISGTRYTANQRARAWNSLKHEIDISMGARIEKVEAKDGKMRLKKTLSIVATDFVPYCLRHTYCTDLQDKGIPLNIAKYLMGHSDIKVTAGIYTHTTNEAIEQAAKLINKAKPNVKNIKKA